MKDLLEEYAPWLFRLLFGRETKAVWVASERMYAFALEARKEMKLDYPVSVVVSDVVQFPGVEKRVERNNVCFVTQYSSGLICRPWVRESWLTAVLEDD